MQPRLTSNSQSYCLSFLSIGITDVHHHAQFPLSFYFILSYFVYLFIFAVLGLEHRTYTLTHKKASPFL
jgi:hypothetical protein